MKPEGIKAVTNVITTKVNKMFSTAEKVGEIDFKNSEQALANAQDALAAQGKAMVKKKYVAPDIKVTEISTSELRAASVGTTDPTDGGGNIGGGNAEGEDGWARAIDVWE